MEILLCGYEMRVGYPLFIRTFFFVIGIRTTIPLACFYNIEIQYFFQKKIWLFEGFVSVVMVDTVLLVIRKKNMLSLPGIVVLPISKFM